MLPSGYAAGIIASLSRRLTSPQRQQSFATQLTTLTQFNTASYKATLAGAQVTAVGGSVAQGSVRSKKWSRELKAWTTVFKQLSKARLSALVVSTASVGFILGSSEEIEWSRLGWLSLGTFGAAACANTLNQVYEVANDARMKRTMMRPLPTGRISRPHAFAFALLMGAGGTAILAFKVNEVTATLGLANIALYAGIYTPLKVVSVANTWVGAVVGAIPPLMGWAAASGRLDPGAAVLALTLYFWQLPHFLSLAWLCREDYLRGGYAMLPRFDPLGRKTAACALRNSLYMLPLGALAVWLGVATLPFGYEAAVAAGALSTTAAIFYQKPSQRSARLLFRFSIAFLPALLLGFVAHRVPQTQGTTGDAALLVAEPEAHPLAPPRQLGEFSAVPLPFLPLPMRSQTRAT